MYMYVARCVCAVRSRFFGQHSLAATASTQPLYKLNTFEIPSTFSLLNIFIGGVDVSTTVLFAEGTSHTMSSRKRGRLSQGGLGASRPTSASARLSSRDGAPSVAPAAASSLGGLGVSRQASASARLSSRDGAVSVPPANPDSRSVRARPKANVQPQASARPAPGQRQSNQLRPEPASNCFKNDFGDDLDPMLNAANGIDKAMVENALNTLKLTPSRIYGTVSKQGEAGIERVRVVLLNLPTPPPCCSDWPCSCNHRS